MQNKQTKASRSRARLLDKGQQNYFRYELEELLQASATPEEQHSSLIQTLWAKGTRDGVDEARLFLKEKRKEGIVDAALEARIFQALDRYSTYR